MPARTKSAASTANPMPVAPAKRFELPALKLNLPSLTEGTDIPPPLPSPVKEEPSPPTIPPKDGEEATNDAAPTTNGKANGVASSNSIRSTTAGTKRPADELASPTFSTRQGSIRRLFSRNLLNAAYANGEAGADGEHKRPSSRMSNFGSSFNTGSDKGSTLKKSRRTSWLSRLRSSDSAGNKRTSYLAGDEKNFPVGPPPPMIPELSELKTPATAADDWSHGDDFFKDIK